MKDSASVSGRGGVLTRRSWWASIIVQALAMALAVIAVLVALQGGNPDWNLLPGVLGSSLAVMVILRLTYGPRIGDPRQPATESEAFEAAVSTGVLPNSYTALDWGPRLAARHQQVRTNARANPIVVVLAVGVQLYDAYLLPEWTWFFLTGAAFFMGVGVWAAAMSKRTLVRIESLQQQIAARRSSSDQEN
jgi:hypothetical protein